MSLGERDLDKFLLKTPEEDQHEERNFKGKRAVCYQGQVYLNYIALYSLCL